MDFLISEGSNIQLDNCSELRQRFTDAPVIAKIEEGKSFLLCGDTLNKGDVLGIANPFPFFRGGYAIRTKCTDCTNTPGSFIKKPP